MPGSARVADTANDSVLCVLPGPGRSLSNLAVYQLTPSGLRELEGLHFSIHRQRECACSTFNLLKMLLMPPCTAYSVEHECRPCKPGKSVYATPTSSKPLPMCSDVEGAVGGPTGHLYAILGGTLGALAFIALLICLIRFILVEIRSGRGPAGRRGRRSVDDGAATGVDPAGGDRTGAGAAMLGIPVAYRFGASELPPAYKDVVPLVAVSSLPTHNFSHYPPSVDDVIREDAGGRGDGESGSAGRPEDGERTPPPSYHEVIALSPTAADMRNRILAAQQHPRTPPGDGPAAVVPPVHRSALDNHADANCGPQA
ncbi:hypothetical protein SprV_0702297100 [Sparganum proliferum]